MLVDHIYFSVLLCRVFDPTINKCSKERRTEEGDLDDREQACLCLRDEKALRPGEEKSLLSQKMIGEQARR